MCDIVSRKSRYRKVLWVLVFFCMVLFTCMGYWEVRDGLPDQVSIVEGKEGDFFEQFEKPWLTLEDAIPVSGRESFTLECSLFGAIPLKQIKVQVVEPTDIYVSGSTVGVYMETQGVLIINSGQITGPDGLCYEPARNLVQPGDYIVAMNQETVGNKRELIRKIMECEGDTVELSLLRRGEEIRMALDPVVDEAGDYKLGIWVRDNTQGIGTLTYMDQSGDFGALGHGISDVDTGELMQIRDGDLYRAQVMGIHKGTKGSPGELSGLIRYDNSNIIGTIMKNGENGIYGHLDSKYAQSLTFRPIEVGYKQEMELGGASILCSVDGEVEEYQVQITSIDLNHPDTNKSFVLKVTDERLLEKTGGIVQGMSGSPVLQNGKVVGAVTHVFVQDSTGGYGIFIENMLKNNENPANK